MAKKKENIDLENNRYGLFMNDRSFELDKMYGREFLDSDVEFSILLYRINIVETKAHKLYGQAKAHEKSFFAPVKLNGMINIEDNTQNYYGDGQEGITREDTGNLNFSVYLDELEEKSVEINRGDIVQYNASGSRPRYYEVEQANNVTDSTSQTIGGFKAYFKRIVAVPIKEDVTPYLSEDKLV